MPLLAEIDPSFIIWLVIVGLFFIGNLIKKAKGSGDKPQRPPQRRSAPPGNPQQRPGRPRPEARPGPTLEEQVREAFREITGAQPVETAPPPPPLPPPVEDPRIRLHREPDPRIEFTPVETEEDFYNISDEDDAFGGYTEIMTMEESQEHVTGASHNTVGTKSMMIDLHHLSVPMFRIPVITVTTTDNATNKPNLRSKKTLRNAVLGRILLEPPKALQPQPSEDADVI